MKLVARDFESCLDDLTTVVWVNTSLSIGNVTITVGYSTSLDGRSLGTAPVDTVGL